jgi:hypothetical protein
LDHSSNGATDAQSAAAIGVLPSLSDLGEMIVKKTSARLLAIGALALGATNAQAAVVTKYTDIGDFEAAIASIDTRTIDFGTDTQTIPNGGTYDGLTFSYSSLVSPATSLEVLAAPPTPATDSVLGTNDSGSGGQFWDGNSIGISFAPSGVFGIVFQSSYAALVNSDFFITVDATNYFIDTADRFAIDMGASPPIYGYFVGVVSDMAFTQVTVSSADAGGDLLNYYNDDIVVASAVPAPATLALLSFGIGLIGFRKSRRDRQR